MTPGDAMVELLRRLLRETRLAAERAAREKICTEGRGSGANDDARHRP